MAMHSATASVAVIRHLAFEDLGSFAPVLEARDLSVNNYNAGTDDIAEPIDSADLVIVLGGPIGVYETMHYPFLVEEREALSRRLNACRPTLGICLGAQLIAAALGTRVYAGDSKEIGWNAVALTAKGRDSCLSTLEGIPVLHWHGDTFDLPDGARLLAGTKAYPHQAFALGQNILALQFHTEIEPQRIEQWLIGHTCELKSAGIDPCMLRHETVAVQDMVKPAGQCLLATWLDQLEW